MSLSDAVLLCCSNAAIMITVKELGYELDITVSLHPIDRPRPWRDWIYESPARTYVDLVAYEFCSAVR